MCRECKYGSFPSDKFGLRSLDVFCEVRRCWIRIHSCVINNFICMEYERKEQVLRNEKD
jgi:hypothetical protein